MKRPLRYDGACARPAPMHRAAPYVLQRSQRASRASRRRRRSSPSTASTRTRKSSSGVSERVRRGAAAPGPGPTRLLLQRTPRHAMALHPDDSYLAQPPTATIEALRLYGESLERYGKSVREGVCAPPPPLRSLVIDTSCPGRLPPPAALHLPDLRARRAARGLLAPVRHPRRHLHPQQAGASPWSPAGCLQRVPRGRPPAQVDEILFNEDGTVAGVRSGSGDAAEVALAPLVIGDPSYFPAAMTSRTGGKGGPAWAAEERGPG